MAPGVLRGKKGLRLTPAAQLTAIRLATVLLIISTLLFPAVLAGNHNGDNGGGGFGAIKGKLEAGLGGSRDALLAVSGSAFIAGIFMRAVPAVSRRLKENGLEWMENALIIVGVAAATPAIYDLVLEIAKGFAASGNAGEGFQSNFNPWR